MVVIDVNMQLSSQPIWPIYKTAFF